MLLAAFSPMPGLRFRANCFALGIRALFRLRRRLSLSAIFHLLFMPMDSTRYFEFDVVWKWLAPHPMRRYLDVSSPRLMPVSLLDSRPDVVADLINPDSQDLTESRRWVDFIDARDRCQLHGCLISDAPFAPDTFDVITSISVLEHIPEDSIAIKRIWNLLRPGGVLVLTVPCMARASEHYIDQNKWGILEKNSTGYIFWQRLYDESHLQQRIYSVTGQPDRVSIFGEKRAGSMSSNAARKRSDLDYPYWREPYMIATEFQYFDRLEDLPGEGVIALYFVKKQ